MARPIPRGIEKDLVSLADGDFPPKRSKSIIDLTIDGIRNRSTKSLVFGTMAGWLAGVTAVRVGRIAAFGLGGGVLILHFATEVRPTATTPVTSEEPRQPLIPKPIEPFKPEETFDKPAFPKPIPHSPKISPSSIPNPNPSVTTNKPAETGYPNYGGYLYNIPGYSAFQPVSYPSVVQPNPAPIRPEPPPQDFAPFPPPIAKDPEEEKPPDEDKDTSKQQDFEEQFTPEIIPAVSNTDVKSESKMNITSLAQGSGATVTIPTPINKEVKKKPERFSLKTSIPISKIDMKCVTSEASTPSGKKALFNPAFQKEERPRVEIQSNIVIKSASKEAESKDKAVATTQGNSISTLINAAEAINKNDGQFRVPEPKVDVPTETKEPSAPPPPQPAVIPRPIFNPMSIETTKSNFPIKPPEGGFNEPKNQIVFVQNKNNTNSKMLVTIQQQNPQVLLQRTNFESKNLQAPSRLSNQKKSKDEVVTDNGPSKVVSLKRLHQDDCDENDFENLITENQIYGNKIVVKEKSQGMQQEQDLKNKTKIDKQTQPEPKNVVLQPNFVYLSNVQFPNLMMIKNNSKLSQTEPNKLKIQNDVKTTEAAATVTCNNNNIVNSTTESSTVKNLKPSIPTKEIHLLKTGNNVLQTLTNNNNKDVIFPNKKVIVHPSMIYKVVDDNKNQNLKNQDIIKLLTQKKEPPKSIDTKNDKVFIACQYQKDIKLQPKIVIDLRPKTISEVEDISTLDIYEKRKRLKRLKYLSNVNKDSPKLECKKEKIVIAKNIITPDNMKAEIFKEFTKTKGIVEVTSDSDSDYGENELTEYSSIIEEYGAKIDDQKDKVEFLAGFSLATHAAYKDKDVERQQRSLKFDSVASAYIAVGRLEHLTNDRAIAVDDPQPSKVEAKPEPPLNEDFITRRKKQHFLAQLRLSKVSPAFKEQYERAWRDIVRDRNRRNGVANVEEPTPAPDQVLDTNTQLLLLTQIKNSVNENNNLIKMRLDSGSEDIDSDIRVLAEKNFSELNRLSKMADRSVKLLSAQDTRKRDLNPGFDSENIQKCFRIEKKDFPKLKIPSFSKIISLKSNKEVTSTSSVKSCQATSMDEPETSAGGVIDTYQESSSQVQAARTKDTAVQTVQPPPWARVDALIRSYREYEAGRKAEMLSLHRRNTALRVECAHITRAASRDSDRARALLAERRHLAGEERDLRTSLLKLTRAIEIVKNS